MDLPDLTAVAHLGPRSTLSHETAAVAWGIELVGEPRRRLTVPLQRSRVVVPGWQVRRLDLPDHDVVVVDGVRVTTPVRTVLDLTQVLPLEQAVAAADSALREGLVSLEELGSRLSSRRGRGAPRPRQVAALVDPLAGSVLESLLRVLVVLAGLPPPHTQYPVTDLDGAFVARTDFAWPAARLVVEADGFAFHSDRAAYRSDRRRVNALERLGWAGAALLVGGRRACARAGGGNDPHLPRHRGLTGGPAAGQRGHPQVSEPVSVGHVLVQPLTSAAEVLLATDHDVFARASLRRPVTQGWHGGGATVWWGVDQHDHSSHVSALGGPGAVGELLGEILPELPPRQRVTLPRGTGARLPAWVGFEGTEWDFRWTDRVPAARPGQERVVEVADAEAVAALLRTASPTASALPGDGDVQRWVGVAGDRGLLACAADTSTSPSVGHLKSIAVHPDARGQGLGALVTSALMRTLFAEGCDVVTLGMYATNIAGRALYDSLGFHDRHRVTSGRLEVRSRW